MNCDMNMFLRNKSLPSIRSSSRALLLGALFLIALACLAQTVSPPADSRGVIRLRVRVKGADVTKGLSRKRFYLIKGSLDQNKSLIQAMERHPLATRGCYYRSIGASAALIKWLEDNDCESVYCREIESAAIAGTDAIPEFQRAFALSEKELSGTDLARKWLTTYLPDNVRDGFYKRREADLKSLIQQAEDISGTRVLSVMTDTRGTAYFTNLPLGTYVISNLLPVEMGSSSISWNCEIQVKAGDLSSEKPFLISNTAEKNVKCAGVEKPLPACDPTQYR